MKAMSKALVLTVVTLMSASAFAGEVGEKKDSKDCAQVATKDGHKAQKASNVVSDEAPKDTKGKKAD